MSSVQNQLVSVLESPSFPPISTVRSGIANSPVRIYANEKLRISFLISELNLNHSLYYDVSRTILRWAKENECELVISSGSLSTQETTKEASDPLSSRLLAYLNALFGDLWAATIVVSYGIPKFSKTEHAS
jgi:predicted ATP-grasp superfamily ATP-dependent carboligase